MRSSRLHQKVRRGKTFSFRTLNKEASPVTASLAQALERERPANESNLKRRLRFSSDTLERQLLCRTSVHFSSVISSSAKFDHKLHPGNGQRPERRGGG